MKFNTNSHTCSQGRSTESEVTSAAWMRFQSSLLLRHRLRRESMTVLRTSGRLVHLQRLGRLVHLHRLLHLQRLGRLLHEERHIESLGAEVLEAIHCVVPLDRQ
jgi:hypothetical protein